MPSLQAEKAPIIQFDYMEYGFDAAASERAGRPIPLTLPFVFIQPDKYTRIEHPAEEWLEKKRSDAINGKVNPEWVTRWEMQYAAWKKGEELPLDGQPIKTWESINKEQKTRLIALGFYTIEQLGDVPDTNLATIGLDGRVLRDLARTALTQHANGGALAIEVTNLKQALRDRDEYINGMQARLAALELQAAGGAQGEEIKRGPGRPKGS